jgi:hypothetical protein
MTDSTTPEPTDLQAEHVLSELMPLFGLNADADRIAVLRPLAAALLRQGASLTSAIADPTLEPLEMGGLPPDAMREGR